MKKNKRNIRLYMYMYVDRYIEKTIIITSRDYTNILCIPVT